MFRHSHFISTLLCVLLALAACAARPPATPQTPPRPHWVDSPASADAPGRLTAVGVGQTRREAEASALSRLAERLTARIQSEEFVARVDEQSGLRGRLEATSRFAAERLSRVSTDVRVLGAQITQVYADATEDLVFALASLDVDAALTAHIQRAQSALLSADEALGAHDRAQSPADACREASIAHARAGEAADEFAVAMALRPGRPGAADGHARAIATQVTALRGQEASIRRVAVAVATPGPTPERIRLAAAGAVTALGANLTTPGGLDAHLRIFVDYTAEPMRSYRRDRVLRRWTLRLEVRRSDGLLLERRERSGTTSDSDGARADARAVAEAAERAGVEAAALLRAALFGEP